jgi:hypothetical protein
MKFDVFAITIDDNISDWEGWYCDEPNITKYFHPLEDLPVILQTTWHEIHYLTIL